MVAVDEQLIAFSTRVQETLDEAAGRSRTSKLWVQYIKLVGLLKLFIFSRRIGHFVLLLVCPAEMNPVFKAAGHFAYAKCTRLYFQQMGKLKQVMPEAEFKMFDEKGMFVARDQAVSDETAEGEWRHYPRSRHRGFYFGIVHRRTTQTHSDMCSA